MKLIEKMTLIPINLEKFIPKEHNKRLLMMQPPNSSKNPKVGPKMKWWKKKKVGARSLIHNTSEVRRHVRAPEWDMENSQARFQNEVNMHNQ
jgi:hypothetical protein